MDKLAAEKIEARTIADWHLHDLRRTAATYLAKLGVERVVITKILNHAESEVTAVYDRHRYDLEKRRALTFGGSGWRPSSMGPGATTLCN